MNKPTETTGVNATAQPAQAQPQTTGSAPTHTKIEPQTSGSASTFSKVEPLPTSKPMGSTTPPSTAPTATTSPLLGSKAGPATGSQKPS